MKRFAFAAAVACLAGCASARADLHGAASTALGVVRAAEAHPELVAEAKAAVAAVASRADPADADRVARVLDHVNAGELEEAQAVLSPLVAASAAEGGP